MPGKAHILHVGADLLQGFLLAFLPEMLLSLEEHVGIVLAMPVTDHDLFFCHLLEFDRCILPEQIMHLVALHGTLPQKGFVNERSQHGEGRTRDLRGCGPSEASMKDGETPKDGLLLFGESIPGVLTHHKDIAVSFRNGA